MNASKLLVLFFCLFAAATASGETAQITFREVLTEPLRIKSKHAAANDPAIPEKVKYVAIVNLISGEWPPDVEEKTRYAMGLIAAAARRQLLQRYGREVQPEFDVRRLKNANMEELKQQLISEGYELKTTFPVQNEDWYSLSLLFVKLIYPEPSDVEPCDIVLHPKPTIDQQGRIRLNVTADICAGAPDAADPDSIEAFEAEWNRGLIESNIQAQVLDSLNGKYWILPAGDKYRFLFGETQIEKLVRFTLDTQEHSLRLIIRAEISLASSTSWNDWE